MIFHDLFLTNEKTDLSKIDTYAYIHTYTQAHNRAYKCIIEYTSAYQCTGKVAIKHGWIKHTLLCKSMEYFYIEVPCKNIPYFCTAL